LDIKKNNPKWFREEEIETDNEIIKRLCNENINMRSKLYSKDEHIKELKNNLKIKEDNYKNAENRFNEELKLLKEEVYEFILDITENNEG
jgi:ribosome maturation protein Sdo1